MFFIGIDISKYEHCAAVRDHSGKIVVKPFKFRAQAKGFELFLIVTLF